jgi:hypothetical protein
MGHPSGGMASAYARASGERIVPLAMKRIHIFQAGRRTSNAGETIEFTEADLAAAARAYDTAKHEAPLVVGHPKTDAPAYGWAKSLDHDAGGLYVEPDQVDPAFAELVEAGRFKKISAAFYRPDHPANPAPGSYYLRHVGFLGAQPPAVKGLKAVAFAEDDPGVIEFSDWAIAQSASLWRRLRDWIIGKHGLEEADTVLPDYAVRSIEDAARDDAAKANPIYSEGDDVEKEELARQEAALKARREALDKEQADKATEFAEREAKIKAGEDAKRRSEIAGFVGSLVKEGKLLPAHESGLVAFMASLDDAGVIEFGEGEQKQAPKSSEWLRTWLSNLPKQVEYNELGHRGQVAEGSDDPAAISAKAVEFQEAEAKLGRTINIAQAVAHVTAKS